MRVVAFCEHCSPEKYAFDHASHVAHPGTRVNTHGRTKTIT